MSALSKIPPQPDLRAFIVYDHAPDGCLIHTVTDEDSEPLLHFGEQVVVDTADHVPAPGELFVIEYKGSLRPQRRIVQFRFQVLQVCCTDVDGDPTTREELCCWASAYTAPRSLADFERQCREQKRGPQRILMSDGPYALNEHGTNDYLEKKIVGKVVGIYKARRLRKESSR